MEIVKVPYNKLCEYAELNVCSILAESDKLTKGFAFRFQNKLWVCSGSVSYKHRYEIVEINELVHISNYTGKLKPLTRGDHWSTVKVWKHRGTIPDVYADPNYIKNKKFSRAEQFALEKIKSIIVIGKIHIAILNQICEMRQGKIREIFIIEETAISSKEIVVIKKVINTLRIQVSKAIEALEQNKDHKLYDNLMSYSLLVRKLVIPNNLYCDRTRKRKKGLITIIDQEERNFVIHHLKVFQAELSI